MAEPLKNQFGTDVPHTLAAMVAQVHPGFAARAFVRDALRGYEALALMPRGRHLATVLQRHLPAHFPEAIDIVLRSARQPLQRAVGAGMGGFFFMPHCFFVAQYGLAHFEASMAAQHELTQRFTAEFSIRPFLLQHPEATLARLHTWAQDPSEHVRRLVSEGTRPRLPWAMRLPAFQADPRPVLALLERLRDDPSLYVRRSVANSLNDIGKDHPALLASTARRWLQQASPERAWLVRHALRYAVKQGDTGALAALGYGAKAQLHVASASVTPDRVALGGKVLVTCTLQSTRQRAQDLMLDLQVHYAKAHGSTRPKVFKLKALRLPGQGQVSLAKTLSLADLSTRKHYPGQHRVELLVNGSAYPLGVFVVLG